MERQSPEINELAAALVEFHGKVKNPEQDREVMVKTKTGQNYTFKYATLAGIVKTIREPMHVAGMAVTQLTTYDEGGAWLITKLLHKSGQWISSELPLARADGNQAFGSDLSYKRRYAIASILSLAGDDDDDANIAEGNSYRDRDDREERRAPPPEAKATNGRAATNAPPSATAEDATFRKLVAAFNGALKNARDPQEADKIWLGEFELRQKMPNSTFEFVRTTFYDTWKQNPPADAEASRAAAE